MGQLWIAGVDEAGRGPIAGPVVAACVVLSQSSSISGIRDSKLLTFKSREKLFKEITQRCAAWAIGIATPQEIDYLNILQASLLAMRRSVERLNLCPTEIWVDGNRLIPNLSLPQRAIVKGDLLSVEIGAASILAKVARDRIMLDYDRLYPEYGFADHKGYPTPEHLRRLHLYGVCQAHRRSYAPVAQVLGLATRAVGTDHDGRLDQRCS